MIKEFLPAVEWLEQNYDQRSKTYNGWRIPPGYAPDGSDLHPERDRNVFRKGPFQLLLDAMCGEPLWESCYESTGEVCTHEEHQTLVQCWCFGGHPGRVLGLEWTSEDEEKWLKFGSFQGVPERHTDYLRKAHEYLWQDGYYNDDTPNNTEWWKEEHAAA